MDSKLSNSAELKHIFRLYFYIAFPYKERWSSLSPVWVVQAANFLIFDPYKGSPWCNIYSAEPSLFVLGCVMLSPLAWDPSRSTTIISRVYHRVPPAGEGDSSTQHGKHQHRCTDVFWSKFWQPAASTLLSIVFIHRLNTLATVTKENQVRSTVVCLFLLSAPRRTATAGILPPPKMFLFENNFPCRCSNFSI